MGYRHRSAVLFPNTPSPNTPPVPSPARRAHARRSPTARLKLRSRHSGILPRSPPRPGLHDETPARPAARPRPLRSRIRSGCFRRTDRGRARPRRRRGLRRCGPGAVGRRLPVRRRGPRRHDGGGRGLPGPRGQPEGRGPGPAVRGDGVPQAGVRAAAGGRGGSCRSATWGNCGRACRSGIGSPRDSSRTTSSRSRVRGARCTRRSPAATRWCRTSGSSWRNARCRTPAR